MSGRLPAAERRDQLLAVALEVFASQGFHATSMNEIAGAAGVTKPVLYQHFPSKRDLYLELLRDVGDRLMAAIGKATAEAGTPHRQVERGFQAYFHFVAEERTSFVLLFGSGARRDEEFATAVRSVERTIADAIATLIDADIDPAPSPQPGVRLGRARGGNEPSLGRPRPPARPRPARRAGRRPRLGRPPGHSPHRPLTHALEPGDAVGGPRP